MAKNRRGGKKKPKSVPFSVTQQELKKDDKQVREIRAESYIKKKASWSFRLMDLYGPWGWCLGREDLPTSGAAEAICGCTDQEQVLTIDTMLRIRARLGDLETMTWDEILGRRDHEVDRSSIIPEAKRRLEELNQDDGDLVSVHLTGQERIWGIFREGIFRILWWDPKHRICRSEKKGT
jgi:hypothetical protein